MLEVSPLEEPPKYPELPPALTIDSTLKRLLLLFSSTKQPSLFNVSRASVTSANSRLAFFSVMEIVTSSESFILEGSLK